MASRPVANGQLEINIHLTRLLAAEVWHILPEVPELWLRKSLLDTATVLVTRPACYLNSVLLRPQILLLVQVAHGSSTSQ